MKKIFVSSAVVAFLSITILYATTDVGKSVVHIGVAFVTGSSNALHVELEHFGE